MEMDQLKSAWKNIGGENKNRDRLENMMKENRHPVLKGIRQQLAIETMAWIIFLFVYYDGFDGDRKPLYVNLLLVAAVLFLVLHSILGYLSARWLVKGDDLKRSLLRYLQTIQYYALVSVASRVLTFICLLLFFTATIHFTTTKYLLLTGIVLLIPLQVFLSSRIWRKRIKKLRAAVDGLTES